MEDLSQQLEGLILNEHSRANADFIANIIISKTDFIPALIEIVFADHKTISGRAAWPLLLAHKKNRRLLNDYIPVIIDKLPSVSSVSVQRCLLSILTTANIPEEYDVVLLNYTTQVLTDTNSSVASIIYSIDIYYNIAKKQPELLNELAVMLEFLQPNATPGIRSKIRKILKRQGEMNNEK